MDARAKPGCGSAFRQGLLQFRILMWKNIILARRNWKSSLAQIFSPVIVVLLLLAFQGVTNWILNRSDEYPSDATPIGAKVPACIPGQGATTCNTMLYAPCNITWVDDVLKRYAAINDLDFTKDFKCSGTRVISSDWAGDLRRDNATIWNTVLDNQNSTQHAVLFLAPYVMGAFPANPFFPPPNWRGSALPDEAAYILYYNASNPVPYVAEATKALDQVMLDIRSKKNATSTAVPEFDVAYKPYPRTPARVAGLDVVGSYGGVWFFLPPMITFFVLLVEIVTEKENRLRIGMRMMGLSNMIYWVTWFFTGMFYITMSTLVLYFAGLACRFPFFVNTNFFAIIIMFWLFGMAMLCVAFFVTTLTSSAKTAQTIGYALILVGFVFQSILTSAQGLLVDMLWTDDVPQWVVAIRWILTFYPPFNLSKVFADIASFSSPQLDIAAGKVSTPEGFPWSNMYNSREVANPFKLTVIVPEPLQQILFQVMDAAIFIVLAWYFDNVLAGEHGSPRPFYFFLTADYWGCKRKKPSARRGRDDDVIVEDHSEDYDSDVESERRKVEDMADSPFDERTEAVRIVNLTKEYRKYALCRTKTDTKAVNNVSMSINNGEIFCLLGHNGAGKTTTINMLTGLFKPSSGDAYVYGYDIDNEMDSIREILGVCPQHDILWKEMTAKEHLQLFAQLKGIPSFLIEREVHEKLTQTGLIDVRLSSILQMTTLVSVADHLVGSFSGGMKRRLSVAISTIGSPKIVFMDEPTTGLDPVNKRAIWHLIQDMKKDRCIILTTHSMEEADVLSDRIAIMAFGKLRCVGNSLHLKSKYGSGYRITLVTTKEQSKAVCDSITSKWEGVQVAGNDAGAIALTIPRERLDYIPTLINEIDTNPNIREWGVSHSTLEEVFLEVTKKHNFKYDDIDEPISPDNDVNGVEDDEAHLDLNSHNVNDSLENYESSDKEALLSNGKSHSSQSNKLSSNAFRALFRKNFTLQIRQKFTNICQILTPVLVILILVILRLVINAQLGGDSSTITELVIRPPAPMNSQCIDLSMLLNATSPKTLVSQWADHAENDIRIAFGGRPDPRMGRITNCRSGSNSLMWFMASDASTVDKMGSIDEYGNSTGMLGQFRQWYTTIVNSSNHHPLNPYVVPQPTEADIQKILYETLIEYDGLDIDIVATPTESYKLPDGYIAFSQLDGGNMKLAYNMSVNDTPYTKYHRPNNLTRLDINLPKKFRLSNAYLIVPEGRWQFMSLINRAFSKWALRLRGINSEPLLPILDLVFLQGMPEYKSQDIFALLEVFGTFLFPIALSLQLPIYIYILVLEKFEKLREMMLSHGMRNWQYHLTNYVFFYLLYALVVIFFWIAGLIFKMRFFTYTHWSTLLVFFVGWGFSLVSLAHFLSSLLNSPRATTVVGYGVALMGSLISLIVAFGIYGPVPFYSVGGLMPQWLYIWPQMSFVRGIYLLNQSCAQKGICYNAIWSLSSSDEFFWPMSMLYATGVVYFVVFLYLDAVLPREYGVPKHPLFCVKDISSCCAPPIPQARKFSTMESDNVSRVAEHEARLTSVEDEDCAKERQRIYDGKYSDDDPLIICNLRKVYPSDPPKVAVKSLCLGVAENECFGLLGENGAGKTTTISMLTGLFPPTDGWAKVAGHDIRTEIDKVHLSMGLCPQFDVIWGDLTVYEHLLFYARLKGVHTGDEQKHVRQLMKDVGLDNARHKLASDLSGGMKRRLSIAIALVGDSRIVFMDEPTTGLDPVTRRQIWAILHRAKKGRAIVLTTHSMDEAELLCNRIGIVALGVMRCLGNQLHLKNKFGEGYNLKINFDPEYEPQVIKFITDNFPAANLTGDFRGTREYILDRSVKIGNVFLTMEKESKHAMISAWSISQVGLEEVFQKIVADSHAAAAPKD